MGGESWLVSQSLRLLPPQQGPSLPNHTPSCHSPGHVSWRLLFQFLSSPSFSLRLRLQDASSTSWHPMLSLGRGRAGVSGPVCSSARGRRLAGVSSDKTLAPPLPKEKLFGISTSLGPAIFRCHPFPSPPNLIPAEGGSDSPQTLAGRGSLSEPQADPAGCSPRVAPPGVTPKCLSGLRSSILLGLSWPLSDIYLIGPRAGLGLQQIVNHLLTS